jgi:hypothetical protein
VLCLGSSLSCLDPSSEPRASHHASTNLTFLVFVLFKRAALHTHIHTHAGDSLLTSSTSFPSPHYLLTSSRRFPHKKKKHVFSRSSPYTHVHTRQRIDLCLWPTTFIIFVETVSYSAHKSLLCFFLLLFLLTPLSPSSLVVCSSLYFIGNSFTLLFCFFFLAFTAAKKKKEEREACSSPSFIHALAFSLPPPVKSESDALSHSLPGVRHTRR